MYLLELLGRLNELIHVKGLEKYIAYSNHSMDVSYSIITISFLLLSLSLFFFPTTIVEYLAH